MQIGKMLSPAKNRAALMHCAHNWHNASARCNRTQNRRLRESWKPMCRRGARDNSIPSSPSLLGEHNVRWCFALTLCARAAAKLFTIYRKRICQHECVQRRSMQPERCMLHAAECSLWFEMSSRDCRWRLGVNNAVRAKWICNKQSFLGVTTSSISAIYQRQIELFRRQHECVRGMETNCWTCCLVRYFNFTLRCDSPQWNCCSFLQRWMFFNKVTWCALLKWLQ